MQSANRNQKRLSAHPAASQGPVLQRTSTRKNQQFTPIGPPAASRREDPRRSETIRDDPRRSGRGDARGVRARARARAHVERRWNSGGTQVELRWAGQRRVRGGSEAGQSGSQMEVGWKSDGSRMEVGWKSDGSRMEVGWSARGTQVELRWNSGGRARGGSEAGQRRVHCRSLQIPLPPCRFPLILKQGEVSRVKLAG